jgi:hypothetical protein
MKRIFLIAVGFVILFGITMMVQPLKAQVYGDFDTIRIVYNTPYQELGSDRTIIPSTSFGLPPNWAVDLDDGYSNPGGIPIGFPFEFNGNVYTSVWVCINGFLTFSQPPYYPSKQPKGLFVQNVSYPINVIAPFWGDHRFRADGEKFNGYMPSEISYKSANGVFTVQWKNLNINDQTVPSSIGSFQVKLYQSKDPYSAQGSIEFCYGQIGGNTYNNGTLVVTKGASVGIKGEFADFMNGLRFQKADGSYFNIPVRQDDSTLTNEWTPSGGTEKRIRFNPNILFNVDQWWGDGDADMSKGPGKKHFNMDQSRFVTVNDARVIMRSVATNVPLDSVRKRNAFHGDVNHNGRYWWPRPDSMSPINWQDMFEGDNLPPQVNTIKRVFYHVTEYDASLILHYISARIPSLPWLLDTIPLFGKISANDVASNVTFGNSQKISDNVYSIPIYLNGSLNGPLGIYLRLDGIVNDVKTVNNDKIKLYSDFEGNTIVISGTGIIDAQTPVAFITVNSNNSNLKIDKIRFNDNDVQPVNLMLSTVETGNKNEMLIQNLPNPFTSTTQISVNVENAGNYTLVVYDENGKRVKTLTSGQMNPGVSNFVWDGTNDANEIVNSGVYIYRLVGDNVSLSKKLVFNR